MYVLLREFSGEKGSEESWIGMGKALNKDMTAAGVQLQPEPREISGT